MRRETFHTPEPLTVEVRNASGRIEIETVDGDETVVELEPLRDSDASQRAVEEATVELRGARLVVDVEDRSFFGLTLNVNREVRVSVRAPHGASVVVAAASADAELRGRFGYVEAKTASGDLAVERVDGDARVKSASGDVALREVGGALQVQSASGDVAVGKVGGEARIRTASGDVGVGEAGASVDVHTASGDQRLDVVSQGRVELKSASGDLTVGIRRGTRAWLDVRSISGETESELDVADPPVDDEGPLVEVAATTMSGDIRIERAAATASA